MWVAVLFALAGITTASSTGYLVTICSSGSAIVRWNETYKPDFSNAVTLTAELRLCIAECAAGESYRVEYALATLRKAFLLLGPRLYDGLTYEALEVRRRSNVPLVMQVCNSTQRLHGESVMQDALKLVSSFSYQLNCNQWNDFCSHLHTLCRFWMQRVVIPRRGQCRLWNLPELSPQPQRCFCSPATVYSLYF